MRIALIWIGRIAGPMLLIVAAQASDAAVPPAVPLDAIGTIVDAFRTHAIVALADNHGNEQCHAFRLSLIRDPRFAAVARDVVVEFGSARYQDVMDRFVRGEDVAYGLLRHVWQDTTQPEYEWDLPVYEEFFRAVRSVNATLPRARQIRVLLGDPPMDWDRVRSLEDLHRQMGDRDSHAVEVIRREVLAKNRRALVIYGGEHLTRSNTARGIVARLERGGLASVFSIQVDTRIEWSSVQKDVASWPVPSLAGLHGTILGFAQPGGPPDRRSVRLEDQFDALLYLGSPSRMSIASLPRALCSDRGYMEMRLKRLALVPAPPGAPVNPADRLRDYCDLPESGAEIPDREPAMTALFRQTLREAALGNADPARIAPESRERLTGFLRMFGPRVLGPLGEIRSLSLLTDTSLRGKRVRRYRTEFANGRQILWTVVLTTSGAMISLDLSRE